MAKFSVHGSLRLLPNGERASFASELKDPFWLNPVGVVHRRRSRGLRVGGLGKVWANGRRAGGFKNEERLKIDDSEEEDEGEVELNEFARDELSWFRGLVLDISYRPVNVVCWKRAICLVFMDKVVKRRRIKQCLSRKNIFYRDNCTCQYCSSKENLTIDHVIPISRRGEWNWENLVIPS